MKHIFKDIEILSRELPENIYVRYAEDRPDFMKILIAGVQETPYAGGLFEFDLWCPGEYPALPPKVTFCTTGEWCIGVGVGVVRMIPRQRGVSYMLLRGSPQLITSTPHRWRQILLQP